MAGKAPDASSPRRDELLALALDVLESEGMESLGPSSLARRAGIKPPSVFKHFSGKADIELRLVEYGFGLFVSGLREAVERSDGSRRGRIAAFATAYRQYGAQHPQLYRLMNNRPLPRSELAPGTEETAMADFLELIPNMDVARSVWSWAHGLVSLELAGRYPDGADLSAAWLVLIDFVDGHQPRVAPPVA